MYGEINITAMTFCLDYLYRAYWKSRITWSSIPENAIRKYKFIAGMKSSSIFRVVVGCRRSQRHQLFASVYVINGSSFALGTDDFILDRFTELDILFFFKGVFQVEEIADSPKARKRRPVHTWRQQEITWPTGLQMEQICVMARICGFFSGSIQIVQFQLAWLIANHQELFVRRESTAHERFWVVVAECPHWPESRVNQFAIHSTACNVEYKKSLKLF